MYYVEKNNDCEVKLIRHNHVDETGIEKNSSIALCFSEEIANLISDFMNIEENLSDKKEFTKVIKDFVLFFSQFLKENKDKKKTYSEMDCVIEILSFLNNMARTYEFKERIFSYQILGFFNNLEKIMYKD